MTTYEQMRDVLIAMLDEKCKQCYINDQICTQGLECHWNGKRGEICQDEAIDKAIAALSAPARNCDRFPNLLKASVAYKDECPVDCDNVRTMTFEEWLFAESKGEVK